MITAGARVAVVDDVEEYAATAAGIVEEAGLAPCIITEADGPFPNTGRLLERIRSENCAAVVCDHRLGQRGLASFTGAEFVSGLYRARIPAVLLSTFGALDAGESIRLYRSQIPSVVSRSDLDPDVVMLGLTRCAEELAGITAPERQAYRTLVRVEQVALHGDLHVADAVIHSWDPHRAIRFPLNVIEDEHIRTRLSEPFDGDVRLFAQVNVGCREDSELFLRAFEWAQVPNIDDIAE